VDVCRAIFFGCGEIMTDAKPVYRIDYAEVLTRFIKYALEGIVVAIAAYTLPSTEVSMPDIVQISAIAMATFSILDFFAPSMSKAARMGAGAGIGANLVGFPGNGLSLR
jgi:hypothetical protein